MSERFLSRAHDELACRQLEGDVEQETIAVISSALEVWLGDGDLADAILNDASDDDGDVDSMAMQEVVREVEGKLDHVRLPKGWFHVKLCRVDDQSITRSGLVDLSSLPASAWALGADDGDQSEQAPPETEVRATLPPLIKTPLFHVGAIVEHRKGMRYEIIGGPDCYRLEATGEPAYVYRPLDGGQAWVRCAAEMEDGRFSL
ncbi:MAG: hypothetical protein RJQ08_04970 [Salinisphaeraceae bacterium]